MLYGWSKYWNGQWRIQRYSFDKNPITKIPAQSTFVFESYKSSLIRFLLDNSTKKFESASDHLYIKGGDEMETDPVRAVVEAASKGVAGAVKAPSDLWELGSAVKDAVEIAYDFALEGANEAAKHGEVSRPGALKSWIDRRVNKRIVIDLQSYAPPDWKKLDKEITFANLATYVHHHF